MLHDGLIAANRYHPHLNPHPFPPQQWSKFYTDARVLPYPLASWARTNKTHLFVRVTLVQPQPVSAPSTFALTWGRATSNPQPTYVGCFVDGPNRDLPLNAGDNPSDNSPANCAAKCLGFAFIGVQDRTNWWVRRGRT